MTTITIRAEYEDAAKEKLNKLVKKAAGYGHVITYSLSAPIGKERKTTNWAGEHIKYTEWFIDVTVEGVAPRVGEHTLLAKLTREAGGVIVDVVPGSDSSVGALGREWAGNCEHCGHDRQRNHGFIVQEGDKRMVVGRTCLRDYLGIDTPEKALWIFQWERNLVGKDEDEWAVSGGDRDWYTITRELLAATSASIDLWGWAPKSGGHDHGDTTVGRVGLLKKPSIYVEKHEKPLIEALRDELRTNAQKHYERADAAVAWAAEVEPGNSDYLHNLKLLMACEWVRDKRAGYVASGIAAYERDMGRKMEAERRAKKEVEKPSKHVGAVGDRITVEVVVEYIRALPADQWGDASVYTFRTADGDKLTWLTSASGANVYGVGREDRVTLTGTVKKHSEYKGVKETSLNRCQIKKLEVAA